MARHSVVEEMYVYQRKLAPTRPHPSAPDGPPGDKILGPPVGLMDRMRDLMSGRSTS